MSAGPRSDIRIRPYAAGDFELLQRLLGDPASMVHLGGPESAEALRRRHERYLADGDHALFTVTAEDGAGIGWVGYWGSSWEGKDVRECGWHVLAEAQGRGVATAAVTLMLDHARARDTRGSMHAFPSTENAASNALCRSVGFECLGEVEVEYPRGRMMRSNDWRFDLKASDRR